MSKITDKHTPITFSAWQSYSLPDWVANKLRLLCDQKELDAVTIEVSWKRTRPYCIDIRPIHDGRKGWKRYRFLVKDGELYVSVYEIAALVRQVYANVEAMREDARKERERKRVARHARYDAEGDILGDAQGVYVRIFPDGRIKLTTYAPDTDTARRIVQAIESAR